MSAGGASFSERSLAVSSIRRLHACQSGLRSLLCRARQQAASSCDLPAGEWRQWLDERRQERSKMPSTVRTMAMADTVVRTTPTPATVARTMAMADTDTDDMVTTEL